VQGETRPPEMGRLPLGIPMPSDRFRCKTIVSIFFEQVMTDVRPVKVDVDSQVESYTASFQTDERFARSWQAVLKKAYKFTQVTCECRGKGAKQLAVKCFAGSDSFSLARFGNSAGEHTADCRFSSDDDLSAGLTKLPLA
jgi:hypothetical protein